MHKPFHTPVTVHEDMRGYVFELFREDEDHIPPIKQGLVAAIHPGVVKAWHRHEFQWDVVNCVYGSIKAGYWHPDYNNGEPDYVILTPRNMHRLVIPPTWYHGWKNIGTETALIVEVVSQLYNREKPDDTRLDPHEFNGEGWIRKDS